VAFLGSDVSFVEEALGVEDYHFAGVVLGGFPHKSSFRGDSDDILVDVVAVVPLAAVDLFDAWKLGEELWVRQRYTPAAA
jgi:hypothetical protein